MKPRLQSQYENEILSKLREELGRENRLSLPRLEKIVINMGVGSAVQEKKHVEDAQQSLTALAGQKAVVTLARKSIANFRLREGMPIGVKVTLRKAQMYEFLDRLINLALPRVRDFRGIPTKSFDGRGNYSMGLTEQLVFPEVNPDKFLRQQGLTIVIVTSTDSDEEGKRLLELFGMPFQGRDEQSSGAA
jgi:large subunit ribosomal protein L5